MRFRSLPSSRLRTSAYHQPRSRWWRWVVQFQPLCRLPESSIKQCGRGADPCGRWSRCILHQCCERGDCGRCVLSCQFDRVCPDAGRIRVAFPLRERGRAEPWVTDRGVESGRSAIWPQHRGTGPRLLCCKNLGYIWNSRRAAGMLGHTRTGLAERFRSEARGGRSSVAERQLPKLNVVGSIPIARSIPS